MEIRKLERSLKTGSHKLITEDIVTNGNDSGIADTSTWTLTHKARDTILADVNLKEKKQGTEKNLIKAETLPERILYYPSKLAIRIGELTGLLNRENFTLIQQRLAEQNMGSAFTILFQGQPGTGKTETVYQIARHTGRDIYLVDISETKSKWFGESEKQIKAVFTRYKAMIKSGKSTPILLFNEADAVLGKRQELGETRSGPAQTENAIQNIILQEMEDLHGGILIATTNMIANLDKAFERRFLYKIEFEKPDHKAKSLIWQNRLSGLSAEDAEALSRRYDFSGGQIENIVRKQTVNAILHAAPITLDDLSALCEDELLDKAARSIGFCAG
jgi:SpoVK/Ycf46/Vps4 family AAA+-type ATPase